MYGVYLFFIKNNMDMTTHKHKIYKEKDILKDIICHQAAKIIQLENGGEQKYDNCMQ